MGVASKHKIAFLLLLRGKSTTCGQPNSPAENPRQIYRNRNSAQIEASAKEVLVSTRLRKWHQIANKGNLWKEAFLS